MSEILKILLVSILFSSFFFLPYSELIKLKNNKKLVEGFDYKTINILIALNLILFFSVLKIEIEKILYIYLILFIFSLIFNFKIFFRKTEIAIIYLVIGISVFILSVDLAYNLTFYWDTQKLWFPKTLNFFYDGSIADLKETSYPHYSFLGSLIWAFFWKLSFMNNEYFGRIIYIFIFCFSIFNFITLSKLSLVKKILIFILLIFLIYDYWHFRGTQEILIFSFLLISSKYLFKIIFEKKCNIEYLFIFFLATNLIIWTKNEGIILSLFLNLTLIFFINKDYKFRFLILFIYLILVSLRFSIFKLYGLDLSLSKDFNFNSLTLSIINNLSIQNVFYIIKYIIISILKFPHILLSLIFAILITFNKSLFKKSLFIYFYLLLSISFVFVIYLSTSKDVMFMVSTGSLRIMFELSAPYLLFVVLLLENVSTKYKIINN